jgi:hypothetical protein
MGEKKFFEPQVWVESHDCQANGDCGLYEVHASIHYVREFIVYIRKMIYLGRLGHGQVNDDEWTSQFINDVNYVIAVRDEERLYLLSETFVGNGRVNQFVEKEFSRMANLPKAWKIFVRAIEHPDEGEATDDESDETKEEVMAPRRVTSKIRSVVDNAKAIWPGGESEQRRLLELCGLDIEAIPKPPKECPLFRYNPDYWCHVGGSLRGRRGGQDWHDHYLGTENPIKVTKGIEKTTVIIHH